MTAEQLEASRAERMRLNGHGALTLEDARTWIEETGLCLFLPRRQYSAGLAPSFVEAVAGERNLNPDQKHISLAEELLVRLELDGIAVRLSTTLNDPAGGGIGTWSSNAPAIALIDRAGSVTGIAPGISVISYSLSNTCGIGFATTPVTVFVLPDAGTISGPNIVCESAQFILSESSSGGEWSSNNPAIATIDSASGLVNALVSGTVIITYTTQPNAGNCINSTTYVLNVLLSHPFTIQG
ncbi:MAG: Ig-like domain-containing protein, partial [Terracidiphilus sp.]